MRFSMINSSRGRIFAYRILMGHRPESIRKWHNRKESLTNVVTHNNRMFSKARS